MREIYQKSACPQKRANILDEISNLSQQGKTLNMSQISARWSVLLLILVLVLVNVPALAQDEAPDIPLVPVRNPGFGIKSVAPADWIEAQPGQYVRNSTPEDPTALLQQAGQVSAAEITGSILESMGMEDFDESSEYETSMFTWEIHRIEDPEINVVISLALAEGEDRTYIMLLQSTPDEHAELYEAVFIPALDALEPLVLSWGPEDAEMDEPAMPPTPTLMKVEVLSEHPHDAAAYTQGLLLYEDLFYESVGRTGQSMLREVDPESGEVLRKVDVPEDYFAEGLALAGDRLVQLTWKAGEAFVYDLESFEKLETFTYEGEGWGLCYDGEYIFKSDGSSIISLHDPETFEKLYQGAVTFQGQPLDQLNELECVGDYIYANVWKQEFILQIDKTNGYVVGIIDASGLLTEDERASLESAAVLNGIAYDPETGNFWITGKLWPKMFEVQFVEMEPEGE